MKTDATPEPITWTENKSAQLIAKIKRSEWSAGCFLDAKQFHAEGFQMDVALAMAMKYWLR